MKQEITCKDVANHICESLGEDFDSPKCREIKKHLENCEYCRDYLSSVDKTIEFYRTYNIDIPKEAHNRLMDCLGLDDEK